MAEQDIQAREDIYSVAQRTLRVAEEFANNGETIVGNGGKEFFDNQANYANLTQITENTRQIIKKIAQVMHGDVFGNDSSDDFESPVSVSDTIKEINNQFAVDLYSN